MSAEEPLALIEYTCERCQRGFVRPRLSQHLGFAGEFHVLCMGLGRTLRYQKSLATTCGEARQQLLVKADDDAYQSFVRGVRFCPECRQFVCHECWWAYPAFVDT